MDIYFKLVYRVQFFFPWNIPYNLIFKQNVYFPQVSYGEVFRFGVIDDRFLLL